MTFKLGLTGSIGTGKSTTAAMFVEAGCALWDADAAVHRLYDVGGDAVDAIKAAFPEAVQDGAVSRTALKHEISRNPHALKTLEGIVHPLVAADRKNFLANSSAAITVLDIPLLFETGAEATMDAVVCVSISEKEQENRVLARGTMTPAQFAQIKSKQMSNDEKCSRSDYVIVTDTIEHARTQVQDVVAAIKEQIQHA